MSACWRWSSSSNPELRRALERIGRFGSLGWLLAPTAQRTVEHVAQFVARAAAILAADKVGALIVLERQTGLQDAAETGVMVEADLTVDLLTTIFTPRAPLHDGAVIIRGDRIAAGCVLPLSETAIYRERFGTRHRAAVGITEGTDALAVVVSEETGAISLVVRGRIIRNLDEDRLRRRSSPSFPSTIPANARTIREGLPLRSRHVCAATHRPRPHRPPPDASRRATLDRLSETSAIFVLRNWPLKLGAILLATVLYSGLVLSQNVRRSTATSRSKRSASRRTWRC